jgi:vanillate O-demethylase ferredoxin subunit
VQVKPGDTILESLASAGVDLPSSCEQGICGACETRVLEGEPDHRDLILSQKEKDANNKMFICCSGSKSASLVLDC